VALARRAFVTYFCDGTPFGVLIRQPSRTRHQSAVQAPLLSFRARLRHSMPAWSVLSLTPNAGLRYSELRASRTSSEFGRPMGAGTGGNFKIQRGTAGEGSRASKPEYQPLNPPA
jgi:hypothetical protein